MDSLFNEKQLAMKLSQGDMDAFEKIYQFYSPKLHCKILKILKSEINAQEVLQDVFLKVWDNRFKIDFEKSLGSYLSCIASNSCYDFFRKITRDRRLQTQFVKFYSTNYCHIEEALSNKENAEILNRAINSLPQKRRQVYLLCKFDGKSYDEVSEQLGISTSTISDHIVKANHFIRTYFFQCTEKFKIEFHKDFHNLPS